MYVYSNDGLVCDDLTKLKIQFLILFNTVINFSSIFNICGALIKMKNVFKKASSES